MFHKQVRWILGVAVLLIAFLSSSFRASSGATLNQFGGDTGSNRPASLTQRTTVAFFGLDHFMLRGEPPQDKLIADTVMVLLIDPVSKTAAVLSVNRDMYGIIPGYNKYDRISHTILIGDKLQYPGGSAMLGVDTLKHWLNISIDHYVTIDFKVFTTIVDAVGPIQVCPKEAIHDPHYPDVDKGFITVDFPTGCQELDTLHLLQYTRAFHISEDDRNRRQQEVVRAVRDKVLTVGGVAALLKNAQTVWDSLKENVNTDMTFQDISDLAQAAQDISLDKIQFATLSKEGGYLSAQQLPDGTYVFAPFYGKVRTLAQKMFGAPAATPAPTSAN